MSRETEPPYRPMSLRNREPVESPDAWGDYGYWNRWGGFHRSTDPYYYRLWLGFLVKHLFVPLHARAALRWMRDRWRHRRCNTVDFHHYACTLDPFGKRLDDDYRWSRVWKNDARATATSAPSPMSCCDPLDNPPRSPDYNEDQT